MPPTTATHVIPEDVAQYCATHHLTSHLETALRLAEESFAPVQGLSVTRETDPESGEEYLVLTVTINAAGERVLDQKQRYTRLWVQSTTSDAGRKIRLAYDLT